MSDYNALLKSIRSFAQRFYVFKPPRDLAAIDADLKVVTDRILKMIEELSK